MATRFFEREAEMLGPLEQTISPWEDREKEITQRAAGSSLEDRIDHAIDLIRSGQEKPVAITNLLSVHDPEAYAKILDIEYGYSSEEERIEHGQEGIEKTQEKYFGPDPSDCMDLFGQTGGFLVNSYEDCMHAKGFTSLSGQPIHQDPHGGPGSFRAAYSVPDRPDLILKVARPRAHSLPQYMNWAGARAKYQTASPLVPKTLATDPDFRYTIEERVIPMTLAAIQSGRVVSPTPSVNTAQTQQEWQEMLDFFPGLKDVGFGTHADGKSWSPRELYTAFSALLHMPEKIPSLAQMQWDAGSQKGYPGRVTGESEHPAWTAPGTEEFVNDMFTFFHWPDPQTRQEAEQRISIINGMLSNPLIKQIRDLLWATNAPVWDIRPANVGYVMRGGKKQFIIIDPGFGLSILHPGFRDYGRPSAPKYDPDNPFNSRENNKSQLQKIIKEETKKLLNEVIPVPFRLFKPRPMPLLKRLGKHWHPRWQSRDIPPYSRQIPMPRQITPKPIPNLFRPQKMGQPMFKSPQIQTPVPGLELPDITGPAPTAPSEIIDLTALERPARTDISPAQISTGIIGKETFGPEEPIEYHDQPDELKRALDGLDLHTTLHGDEIHPIEFKYLENAPSVVKYSGPAYRGLRITKLKDLVNMLDDPSFRKLDWYEGALDDSYIIRGEIPWFNRSMREALENPGKWVEMTPPTGTKALGQQYTNKRTGLTGRRALHSFTKSFYRSKGFAQGINPDFPDHIPFSTSLISPNLEVVLVSSSPGWEQPFIDVNKTLAKHKNRFNKIPLGDFPWDEEVLSYAPGGRVIDQILIKVKPGIESSDTYQQMWRWLNMPTSIEENRTLLESQIQKIIKEEKYKYLREQQKDVLKIDVVLRYEKEFSFYGNVLNQIRAIRGITIAKAHESGVVSVYPDKKQIILHLKFIPDRPILQYASYLKTEFKKIKDTEGENIISVRLIGFPTKVIEK